MTISRREIFTEAWSVARSRARKSGQPVRAVFNSVLGYVWAIFKEAARRAALPAQANAWTMGAPAVRYSGMFGGGMVRAHYSPSIYNGW